MGEMEALVECVRMLSEALCWVAFWHAVGGGAVKVITTSKKD